MENNELICITDLITKRKWTRNLIKEFLGEPDKEITNPYYPTSYPIKLYTFSRVLKNERSIRFKTRMQLINQHREKMKSSLRGYREVV